MLADVAEAVDLKLQGFLARPLYMCTPTSGSDCLMCMSVAGMSQLITHTEGRLHDRCCHCVQKWRRHGAPGSNLGMIERALGLRAIQRAAGHLHPTPMQASADSWPDWIPPTAR